MAYYRTGGGGTESKDIEQIFKLSGAQNVTVQTTVNKGNISEWYLFMNDARSGQMTITIGSTTVTTSSSYLEPTTHFDALSPVTVNSKIGKWYICSVPLTDGIVIKSKGAGGSGSNIVGIFM